MFHALIAKADGGDSHAQYEVAFCFFIGKGVPINPEQAIHYYTLAADGGNAVAQYELAELYIKGWKCLAKNHLLAFHYYRLAAEQNHAKAQFELATCYLKGIGTAKSETNAFTQYAKAAENGHVKARYETAVCYAQGKGVVKNMQQAFLSYQKAADNEHPEACYQTALCLTLARGIERNDEEAFRYYKKAAKKGHKNAQVKLAFCFQNGMGTTPNDKKAVKYLKLAAEQDDPLAQHQLSIRYTIGRGVLPDENQATSFYRKATTMSKALLPSPFASKEIVTLLRELAPSLLIRVAERKPVIAENSLAGYILSPRVDLQKSRVVPHPPEAIPQRGPVCGFYALRSALRAGYPGCTVRQARKNDIKPTAQEKMKNKELISMRDMAKKSKNYPSVIGEMYDVRGLDEVAKGCGFDECKVIKSNQDSYIATLLRTMQEGYNVVLPVDCEVGFPANRAGKGAHYALAWGSLSINNQDYFLVTHIGKYCLWSADALLASHKQMPDQIEGVELYKDDQRDDYLPVAEEKYPASKRRTIPRASLEFFKFSGLAVPTQENSLRLKIEGGVQTVYSVDRNNQSQMLFKIGNN